MQIGDNYILLVFRIINRFVLTTYKESLVFSDLERHGRMGVGRSGPHAHQAAGSPKSASPLLPRTSNTLTLCKLYHHRQLPLSSNLVKP